MARTAEHPAALGYQRHRPERTLLYRLIKVHYPAFADLMAAQGRVLPISQRIARCLEKQGLLVRDMDNSYLDLEPGDASPADTVLGPVSAVSVGALKDLHSLYQPMND